MPSKYGSTNTNFMIRNPHYKYKAQDKTLKFLPKFSIVIYRQANILSIMNFLTDFNSNTERLDKNRTINHRNLLFSIPLNPLQYKSFIGKLMFYQHIFFYLAIYIKTPRSIQHRNKLGKSYQNSQVVYWQTRNPASITFSLLSVMNQRD